MPVDLSTSAVLVVAGAFAAGLYTERWRAALLRRRWRNSRGRYPQRRNIFRLDKAAEGRLSDPADQLRVVMSAKFEKRRLLSKSEARIFYAAEKVIRDLKLKWRVMAQVSLGEVLSSPEAPAYSAINSKRVDLLLISSDGYPIAAIEYQGLGHHQGTAAARDAVKKEALRRAGVRYIEVTPQHGTDDLEREILRMANQQMA